MNDRNKQKQLWADVSFKNELERLKAERLLSGIPADSLAQLTKELVQCPSYPKLKQELLNGDVLKKIKQDNIKLRLDKKRLF